MLSIRQPVAVKIILTELAKQQILTEQRRQVEQLMAELEQIEQQGKQAIEEAMAQGGQVAQQIHQQLDEERAKRFQQREQLIQQIQQIQQLELGTELQNMTVETNIDVSVGDDWNKILLGSEIIVKDGVINEIRRGGESVVRS